MDLEKLNLKELSIIENQEIEGGTESNLWEDVAYGIGVFVRGLKTFGDGKVSGSANRFA